MPKQTQSEWLTKEVLFARLFDIGVVPSERSIRGWREAGLLPRVDQVSKGRAGTVTLYPANTIRQIAAISALKQHHRNNAALGWELWWQGYEVDENYWRPEMEFLARMIVRIPRLISRLARRYKTGPTFAERVKLDRKNPVTSRLLRRMSEGDEAAFIATSMDVASGEFDFFRDIPGDSEGTSPEAIMIHVHDLISDVEVNGQRLNQVAEFPRTLKAVSAALSINTQTDMATGCADAIQCARDDVRHALQIASDSHEALAWIFGARHTGLRHAAWLARKGSRQLKMVFILGFIVLRRTGYEMMDSHEIETMAADAARLRTQSDLIRCLGRTAPYEELFTPKAIRAAITDGGSRNAWRERLKTARIKAYSVA